MPNIAYLDFYYEKTATVDKLYNGGAFTITAFYDNTTIYINRSVDFPEGTVLYYNISYDYGMSWTTLVVNEDEVSWALDPINAGANVIITGTNEGPCYINIGADKAFKASGNIMTLLDAEDPDSIEELPEYCFRALFEGQLITNAAELILPMTTLSDWCYADMFRRCTMLVNPPVLPATILASGCYQNMFEGCTSLITPPDLHATTLSDICCANMFNGCTSLTTVPALPATILASGCYQNMFEGCTSLGAVSTLPATTLAASCYFEMFKGCTSLNTAPALPATTLANYCYSGMFRGCTSLGAAPTLPAPVLVPYCYSNMFNGCTSLNYIKVLGVDRADYDTENWVYNVAPSGTFVKDINGVYVPDQPNGIPIGWTVYNEGEVIVIYYNITALVDPEGYGTVTGGGTYHKNSAVTLRAIPNEGYMFDSWYSNGAYVAAFPTITITASEDKTYVAKFIVDPNTYYNVTLSQDPEIGAVLQGAGRYVENTQATITAPVMNGYIFRGWSLDETIVTTERVYTFTVTEDVEYTAIYEAVSEYYNMYFTIESLRNNNPVRIFFQSESYPSYIGSIEYCINGETWLEKKLNVGWNNITTLNTEDYICFRNAMTNQADSESYITFGFSGANVYGNIMSLLENHFDYDFSTDTFYNGINLETLSVGEKFKYLFNGSNVINASNLLLPAMTLSTRCYDRMFWNCVALTSTPALPATTLADHCYYGMFEGCTSLVTAPALPATTLSTYCYASMFDACESLVNPPALPATTMSDFCYSGMFSGCISLVTAPTLPATTLAEYCYQNMFYGCLALANITCLATNISAWSCTLSWTSRIASGSGTPVLNGTFTKAASMNDWTRGEDGIPEGWTIVNAS